jgi:hypothetical protein
LLAELFAPADPSTTPAGLRFAFPSCETHRNDFDFQSDKRMEMSTAMPPDRALQNWNGGMTKIKRRHKGRQSPRLGQQPAEKIMIVPNKDGSSAPNEEENTRTHWHAGRESFPQAACARPGAPKRPIRREKE